MKEAKRKKLEAAGWRVGSAAEFLEQGPPREDGFLIPAGWTLEPMERQPDHMLLSTPAPRRYMTTIDFRMRGLRSGWSTIGRLLGEEWNKPRKKYGGRGWKQALVDDAVAHLQTVL
jgi:hypothetical protein